MVSYPFRAVSIIHRNRKHNISRLCFKHRITIFGLIFLHTQTYKNLVFVYVLMPQLLIQKNLIINSIFFASVSIELPQLFNKTQRKYKLITHPFTMLLFMYMY